MSDPASWQDLKRRFLELLSQHAPERSERWVEVWRLFLEHPWYRTELRTTAGRLLRRQSVSADWEDDVQQDAMLLLARSLRRNADLGVDRGRVDKHFPGWLGRIITRDCLQALRRLRSTWVFAAELIARDLERVPAVSLEQQIDLSLAMDELREPERTVLLLYAKQFSVPEIADALGLSYMKAYRALRRGLLQLRHRLL